MQTTNNSTTLQHEYVGALIIKDANNLKELLKMHSDTFRNESNKRMEIETKISCLYLPLSVRQKVAKQIKGYYTTHNLLPTTITE